MTRETPNEYAQRRANETGRPYLVTDHGHAMMLWGNRRTVESIGCKIVAIYRKQRDMAQMGA